MKKLFALISVVLALNTSAWAQVSSSGLIGLGMSPELAGYFASNGIALNTLTNNSWLKSANATPGGTALNLLKAGTSNNTHLNALTGKVIDLDVATTPVAVVDVNGLAYQVAGMGEILPAGQVITPATNLTPVAGARLTINRLLAVATAAPTANFVFAQPTAIVGKQYKIYNQGANPVQILPEDGTLNALGALTPFACAAGKICTVNGISSTQAIVGAQ